MGKRKAYVIDTLIKECIDKKEYDFIEYMLEKGNDEEWLNTTREGTTILHRNFYRCWYKTQMNGLRRLLKDMANLKVTMQIIT